MNEHNEIRDSAGQVGFVVGCIISSVIWYFCT